MPSLLSTRNTLAPRYNVPEAVYPVAPEPVMGELVRGPSY